MCTIRFWSAGACVLLSVLVASLPFTQRPEQGCANLPPSETLLLAERYPELRQMDSDLAAGRISLEQAVEIFARIAAEDAAIRSCALAYSKNLRQGLALLLCERIENYSELEPFAEKQGIREQLRFEAEAMPRE